MEQKTGHPTIPAQLIFKEGTPAVEGRILKLTQLGVLFETVGTTSLLLGDSATIQFQFPEKDTVLQELVKVMKTYLRYSDQKANLKLQMFEFHFTAISNLRKSQISAYLETHPEKNAKE